MGFNGPVAMERSLEVSAVPNSLLRLFAPISDLLAATETERILVMGPDSIHADQGKGLTRLTRRFPAATLETALTGLAQRAGKPFDAARPVFEALLKDGTRFLALRPPVTTALTLSIERPAAQARRLEDWTAAGLLTAAAEEALCGGLARGMNILVVGDVRLRRSLVASCVLTGTPGQRVAVVDAHWIPVDGLTVTRLSPSRPAQGRRVTAGDLVYSGGRLAVDRLVVGDVGQSEAWDVVTVMAERAVPTLAACSGARPVDGLMWLTGWARAGAGVDRAPGVSGLVGSGIDLVVSVGRQGVHGLCEVEATIDGPRLHPLFSMRRGRLIAEARYEDWAREWDLEETGSVASVSLSQLLPPGRLDGPSAAVESNSSRHHQDIGELLSQQRAPLDGAFSGNESTQACDIIDDEPEQDDLSLATEVSDQPAPGGRKTFSEILRGIDDGGQSDGLSAWRGAEDRVTRQTDIVDDD